jgi:uncharacterized protein (TIGR02646 family)
MIYVYRGAVKPPSILSSTRVKALKESTAREVRQAAAQVEIRFDPTYYRHPEVLEALDQLFHHKCAYCESPLIQEVDVDHFRPTLRAINLKGDVDPIHYYWLAYEWENLYLSCAACVSSKGTRFPVKGTRAAVGDSVSSEEPLLLDPCLDKPASHLVYLEKADLVSSSERGQVTIEVFSLNRTGLVKQRLEVLDNLRRRYQDILKKISAHSDANPDLNSPEMSELLAEFTSPGAPFVGMCQQFLSEWTRSSIGDSPEQRPVTKSMRQKAKKDYTQYQQENVSFSLDSTDNIGGFYLRDRKIEKIELRNYKIIQNLTITPPSEKSTNGSWLMLLGENGTGKSSVLQALALTLVGDSYRSALPITPEQVLRKGSENGYVKVQISGFPDPIRLDFSRGSDQFSSNMPDPKVPLLAYGATRLLPRTGYQPETSRRAAHVDNLFNPFIPLGDASKWLSQLHARDPQRFDKVARALKKLLLLGPYDELLPDEADPEKIVAKVNGTTVPLEWLSDGYQTVLALVVDIFSILLNSWDSMEIAEGIVLIDEIGSHLHPYWQMRVVDRLREALPRVQFIISTHYPLCLRGMKNDEVVILRRSKSNRNKIILLDQDLPPVEGMRVDQILTSEFFGLESAIDPKLDKLYKVYYGLLARRELSPRQKVRLETLKKELDQYKVFGDTPRERMQLEAIDQFLATEDTQEKPEDRQKYRQNTINLVAGLWAGEKPGKGGGA